MEVLKKQLITDQEANKYLLQLNLNTYS